MVSLICVSSPCYRSPQLRRLMSACVSQGEGLLDAGCALQAPDLKGGGVGTGHWGKKGQCHGLRREAVASCLGGSQTLQPFATRPHPSVPSTLTVLSSPECESSLLPQGLGASCSLCLEQRCLVFCVAGCFLSLGPWLKGLLVTPPSKVPAPPWCGALVCITG